MVTLCRVAYLDVFQRYGKILQPAQPNLNHRDFCEAVLVAFGLEHQEYQLGLTKVFFRPGTSLCMCASGDRVLSI